MTETLADYLAAHTRPDGEHARWNGPTDRGHPVTLHNGHKQSARVSAWITHHGASPAGRIRTTCGQQDCLAPDHLDDGTANRLVRELLAELHAVDLTGPCSNARHDLAEHGGIDAYGYAMCRACKADRGRYPTAQLRPKGYA